ncbi:MAG: aldose 1-epimerase family protein [Oscillospiraceae bacterium]|nr:aldose 1-epimerase family protein [Oscillospiraceae bacterium]
MNIYGRQYSREELLRHCNTDSLYTARRIELADGRGRGSRMVEVKTAGGLRALLAEDKCLDIVALEYKGVNLGFLSKNGIVNTPVSNPEVNSFVKYWPGGFLSTCGLRNTGPSCEIDGEFFPLHGHIGLTPAESVNTMNVCIDGEDTLIITGNMRESALFGHCLEMERRIVIPAGGECVTVYDTVHNLSPHPEPVLMLYHINFGFPFLSEGLVLDFPEGKVRGRTGFAEQRISEHKKTTAPIDGEPEVVFFHTPSERSVKVVLKNERLGLQAQVRYDSERLPVLAQWKSMRAGDYALGIEPGTSFIRGRKEELENGYDIALPAFGQMQFGFTVELSEI